MRSSSPIFRGQRITIFMWFLDDARRILGKHLDTFDIDEWFYALDQWAVSADPVIPQRTSGAWLESMLLEEAKRRGLPVAGAMSPGEEFHARLPHAWTCKHCGQIHEGTVEQRRRGECLKGKVAL